MGASQVTGKVLVNNIPEQVRTVPTHPDDPYVDLPPFENRSYDVEDHDGFAHLGVKVYLFSFIGAGVNIKESGKSLENEVQSFSNIDYGESFDYTQLYGGAHGAAYSMYQISLIPETEQFSYSINVKTPTLTFWMKDGGVSVGVFAGYEFNAGKFKLYALNGWDRFGDQEIKDTFDLGEIEFDRAYAGVSLGWKEDLLPMPMEGGINLSWNKFFKETKINPGGEGFDLEFKEIPDNFGFDVYVRF